MSGIVNRVKKWHTLYQYIKSLGYRAHKTIYKATNQILDNSVYSSLIDLINGITFWLKSSTKNLRLTMKDLLKEAETINFKIFTVKLNNKTYTALQLLKSECSLYENNTDKVSSNDKYAARV